MNMKRYLLIAVLILAADVLVQLIIHWQEVWSVFASVSSTALITGLTAGMMIGVMVWMIRNVFFKK